MNNTNEPTFMPVTRQEQRDLEKRNPELYLKFSFLQHPLWTDEEREEERRRTYARNNEDNLTEHTEYDNRRITISGVTLIPLREIAENEYPDRSDIIEGVITVGSNILSAKKEAGKSLFALNGGFSVAEGSLAFSSLETQIRHVLYFNAEENESLTNFRLDVLRRKIPPNFHMAYDLPNADEGGITALGKILKRFPNSLVILDPFGYFLTKKTLSQDRYQSDILRVKPWIDVIKKNNGTLFATHHARKSGDKKADDATWRENASGSTGIVAPFETHMYLERPKNDPTIGILQRGGRTVPRDVYLRFRFEEETFRWIYLEDENFRMTPLMDKIYKEVENSKGLSTSQLGNMLNYKDPSITRACSEMKLQGLIVKIGGQKGKWTTTGKSCSASRNIC